MAAAEAGSTLSVGPPDAGDAASALLAAIVECSSDAILSWTLDGVITSWNAQATRMYGYAAEEAVGRSIYMLIPSEHHASARQTIAAVGRGESFQRLEARRVRKDGSLIAVSLTIFPVRNAAGAVVGAATIARDITERKEAEAALQASHARISEILESIDDAFFAVDRAWRFTYVNRHCERLWGRPRAALLGRDMWEMFPGLHGSGPGRAYVQAAETRRPVRVETVAVSLGRPIDLAIYPSPSGLSVYFRDISERKRAEERQRLLMAELDHRVKNVLAVIQALARQTLPRSEATDAFVGRLAALSQTHALLARGHWTGASLVAILRAELAPYMAGGAEDRVAIRGDDLTLRPRAAQTLTMVMHELATNAAKHGALSAPGGRVAVSWAVEPDEGGPRLVLSWTEQGGPPVAEPTRRGFGRLLIERGAAYELQGQAEMRFLPDGLRCRISFPLANAAGTPADAPRPAAARRRRT